MNFSKNPFNWPVEDLFEMNEASDRQSNELMQCMVGISSNLGPLSTALVARLGISCLLLKASTSVSIVFTDKQCNCKHELRMHAFAF